MTWDTGPNPMDSYGRRSIAFEGVEMGSFEKRAERLVLSIDTRFSLLFSVLSIHDCTVSEDDPDSRTVAGEPECEQCSLQSQRPGSPPDATRGT